jgi:hypothetical protein
VAVVNLMLATGRPRSVASGPSHKPPRPGVISPSMRQVHQRSKAGQHVIPPLPALVRCRGHRLDDERRPALLQEAMTMVADLVGDAWQA